MTNRILYGDGIHDDTAAIQEMIDSGACEVTLPVPQKLYLISKPLVIPSNFKLKLPRYAEIKLADNANCFMLMNKTKKKPQKRLRNFLTPMQKALWYYVDELSPDEEDECNGFEIEGGIWNFNNLNQTANPIYTKRFDQNHYLGHTMFFYNARNFRLSNMTFKDPSNYAVMIDVGSYFTIENIVFDFNYGNPIASNMDGIHLNGNCHFGIIRNLQGACYDDLIALNAHEGLGGDISNIEIDGVFAENCHSAVRFLTVNHDIRNVTVSNVFGTFYQYCIGFTKFYPGETTGCFDSVSLNNVCASKSRRLPIQEAHMGNKSYHFPLVWLQADTLTKSLKIDGLHRRESVNPVDTVHIGENAVVENLFVYNLSVENLTEGECNKMVNLGTIKRLVSDSLSKSELENDNHGTIERVYVIDRE